VRMNQREVQERLSRIETHWTAVFQAHGTVVDARGEVRNQLMLHYSAAVYKYLLGALKDPDAAADLCQEFAVRFLRGDFHRASPTKGRFRDYVKTALINLVNDFHRSRQARPAPLAVDAADPHAVDPGLPSDNDFLDGWRASVLDQTWKALESDNPTFHTLLQLRIENPDMQSPEMAEKASKQLGRPITPENVRKSLQRAHARFAELLLDQVEKSLDDPTDDDLKAELEALDLLRYCRSAVEKRKSGK
jgi:DNA-directed RNA polymerase specialized sigma24 family protein